MSEDWHVYCRTCKSEHPFSDANHRSDLMVKLIRHSALLASLKPFFDDHSSWEDIEFRVYYGRIDVNWFAEHVGHDLVPRSEYGQILGQCFARVKCTCCKTEHKCILDKGHTGDHQHGTL